MGALYCNSSNYIVHPWQSALAGAQRRGRGITIEPPGREAWQRAMPPSSRPGQGSGSCQARCEVREGPAPYQQQVLAGRVPVPAEPKDWNPHPCGSSGVPAAPAPYGLADAESSSSLGMLPPGAVRCQQAGGELPLAGCRMGLEDGAEAALQGPSPPRTWHPPLSPCSPIAASWQALPWALSLHHPPWPCCCTHWGVPTDAWGCAGAGDSWHPRDRSVSPADSSLCCSRFSMVLLCSLLEAI